MRWLVALLVVSVALLGCSQEEKYVHASYVNLTVEEAFELIKKNYGNESFVILDVRTPEEFAEGHIKGAINIDFYSPDFKRKLNELDRNKTYLVYCRTGHRSSIAAQMMVELGFKHVYNMNGGILEWKDRGYPVVK